MLSCCKILIIPINASNGMNSVVFFTGVPLSRCPTAVGLLEMKIQIKKKRKRKEIKLAVYFRKLEISESINLESACSFQLLCWQ